MADQLFLDSCQQVLGRVWVFSAHFSCHEGHFFPKIVKFFTNTILLTDCHGKLQYQTIPKTGQHLKKFKLDDFNTNYNGKGNGTFFQVFFKVIRQRHFTKKANC